MNTIQLTSQYYKYLKNSKYAKQISEAIDLCFNGRIDEAQKILDSLPTTKQLLTDLVEKLKGKSVYTTLNKILEGKADNDLITLKGISSLKTHCIIEAEKNPEYLLLLEEIDKKYYEIRNSLIND